MKTHGIGVIGTGGRIRGVLAQIPQLGKRIKIVALCDPSRKQIEQTKKRFELDNVNVYADYKDLVKDPAVDWVFVGSWNCFHREQVIAAFKAGKHVFCEKPMATTLADALAMKKAWEKTNDCHFSIGFTLRYSPHYRKIKQILDKGTIGDIISMEFNETLDFNHGGYIHSDWRRLRKNAGTHLLEKCCHDIDLVNWFVESPAARVASFGGLDFFLPKNKNQQARLGKNKKGEKAFETWENPDPRNPFTCEKDIIDNQVAIVEFANGVRTTFHTNCCSGIPERRMYINGTEGTVRADVISGSIQVRRFGWNEKIKNVPSSVAGGHGGGDQVLGKSLQQSILQNKPPFTGLTDGLKSAVTAFGLDKACDTGRVVDMAPLWKRAGLPLA